MANTTTIEQKSKSSEVSASVLLSNSQAARRLGVSAHYLDAMRYRGAGPAYVRLSGRRVMYDPNALEAWIASRTIEAGR